MYLFLNVNVWPLAWVEQLFAEKKKSRNYLNVVVKVLTFHWKVKKNLMDESA